MEELPDKMVHVRMPLSFAKNLKWYTPPCPLSEEAWEYTYPSGTTVICLAVSPPYAENGPMMVGISKASWGYGKPKTNETSVVCIADPGQGFLHLGLKMESMPGEWKLLGKVHEALELIKTK